jgi:starvation-inducible DNA-binding protein
MLYGRRCAAVAEGEENGGLGVQQFSAARQFPIGLSRETRLYSCQRLNQVLADTQILYALYKKHHCWTRGATFYQLHLLLDRHAGEQRELADMIGERVQTLGGVAVGDPRHVAGITTIQRPPNGVEEVPAVLVRLLETHETILIDAREAAARTQEMGDDGTNDLLVSDVIRTGELQVWFLAEHLVETPLPRLAAAHRPARLALFRERRHAPLGLLGSEPRRGQLRHPG